MRSHQIDKHYLYLRDGGKCFFCSKALRYDKVTVDHYLPKSMGGTDEIFNLVTSCKACNGIKKNVIPEDVEKKHLEWFIQGVLARKILAGNQLKISNQELDQLATSVKRTYISGEYTIFETLHERLYVKENKVCQVAQLNQSLEEDWINQKSTD